jgi:hypothetical protein
MPRQGEESSRCVRASRRGIRQSRRDVNESCLKERASSSQYPSQE